MGVELVEVVEEEGVELFSGWAFEGGEAEGVVEDTATNHGAVELGVFL